MSRSWTVLGAVVVFVAALALTPVGAAGLSPGAPGAVLPGVAAKPNVVLVVTDDMTTSDLAWMPQTRALLVEEGVRFTNALSPNPLCCPARATILSGQLSQNNGVRGNSGRHGGWKRFDNEHTIATTLHDAGYHTGFVGKYLNLYNGQTDREPGWDDFDAITLGLYDYYDFASTNSGDPQRHEGIHSNDYVAQRTVAMIDEYSVDDAPFFVSANYVAPHGVCVKAEEISCDNPPRPAARHADLYPDVVAPDLARPSLNENVKDKPAMIRGNAKVDRARVQELFTERIRSLASVDEGVAATVDALRRTGELADTLFVFTSDNGFLIGEHRYIGKVLPYRESIGIPLVMRGPGIPAGETRRQQVTLADLAPTIAATAGATPQLAYDGLNLLPYAVLDYPQRDATALIQTQRHKDGWTYRGVTTRRYTYTQWRDGFTELYDHDVDPYERGNLAGHQRYAAVEKGLKARLVRLRTCAGARSCHPTFAKLPRPIPSLAH